MGEAVLMKLVSTVGPCKMFKQQLLSVRSMHISLRALQVITVCRKDICYRTTDQDGSIDLMSVRFDLGIGNRVVIQHSLEVGPVGRKMWKEHSLNSLPRKTN